MKIQFYGHAGVKIEDDLIILIDPWLNDNPLARIKAKHVLLVSDSCYAGFFAKKRFARRRLMSFFVFLKHMDVCPKESCFSAFI